MAAFLAGGHILLEDVPGVGKTTLAKALAQVTGGTISRIQCTPDLLPSDVVGFSIPIGITGEFSFKKGPIFSNVVLVDEINRAAPRTQSAFLEAMEESQVTVEGETRSLPEPFMLIATQNPVETAGTYPLPESQMDRFDVRLTLGYPQREGEIRLLTHSSKSHGKKPVEQVYGQELTGDILQLVESVTVAESLIDYVYRVGEKSRSHASVNLGISPRGLISWVRVSKAYALLMERDYAIPEDFHEMAYAALAHRLVAKTEHLGLVVQDPSEILKEILQSVQLPL
ncbi:MoxR family ATPase [Myxococcota bacterium]|nr:MoxR family ATPase [Myxococcota bacterium]